MSLSRRKARVDASAGKNQKPLLKLAPLPPLSALSGMTAAERAKAKELVARHREATAGHFAAKRAGEAAEELATKPDRGLDGDEEEDDLDDDVGTSTGDDDDEDDEDDEDAEEDGGVEKVPFENSLLQPRPGRKQQGWFTPKWCAEVTQNPTEARVLGQLAFWFGVSEKTGKCRAKIIRDGSRWIYKRYPQLARETRLSEKQVGDAVRNFIDSRIVVTMEDADYGRLLRLDPARIAELRLEAEEDQ